ncbi:MAG TPA: response regulator, partial [Burkholderiales bacterium]|nr:response regulator [Burkholderiales bacterium]
AKQSGGDARIHSAPGHGTTVTLYLPIAKELAQPATYESNSHDKSQGHESVLLAEDDEAVRHSAAALLTDLGYRVIEAADGRAALERLEEPPEIALLFSDVVMPGGLSGPELAIAAKRLRPDLKILFTSGYAEQALLRHGKLELISKPYSKEALARKIRAGLDAHTPEPA